MLRTLILAGCLTAVPAVTLAQSPKPSLPRAFAGWTEIRPTAASPPAAGQPDAAVLQEYGLVQTLNAAWASGANQLAVRALRFHDATGAYGAFTFYRTPQMHPEEIASAAASQGNRFLVWTGATLVDATFLKTSADNRVALHGLVALIPPPAGADGIAPSLPHYLPAAALDPATVRYAIGPAAYAQMGGGIPAADIDFSQDAEVLVARYGPAGAQQGTLTLIMYPTPQIAAGHLKSLTGLAPSAALLIRRSGPLVAAATANYPRAQQLLDSVRFSDFVTINHPEGYVSEAVKVSRLLLGIAALTGILLTAALLLGIFLGGGRALLRMLRGKPVSTVSEEEFISLHLEG